VSGLTTPVFLGLIAGEVVTLGITKAVLSNLAGVPRAIIGVVSAVLAWVALVVTGYAVMESLADKFPSLDTEAWVLGVPLAAGIGCAVYWICDGIARMIKARNNV
jgi:predicted lysophospholipase L1 biosynthesis ABC-type transport system permease subunit